MVSQEARHRSSLIVRHLEEVAEASSAEDDLLASALRVVDSRAWVDLRCADARDERASDWEVGIELDAGTISHRIALKKSSVTLEDRA